MISKPNILILHSQNNRPIALKLYSTFSKDSIKFYEYVNSFILIHLQIYSPKESKIIKTFPQLYT
jgi:hypothetical protein